MTGMPQGQDRQGYAAGQPAPPLPVPGPLDETAPRTIVPGPAAEDSPGWRPAVQPVEQMAARYDTSPASTARGSINSVLSETKRNGRWEVPAVLTVSQAMSDVHLDLREAVITSPVVEIRVQAMMAELQIVVPPGVQVEWAGGFSLMSSEKADPPRIDDPSMWRLRIVHHGLMNDVRVRTLAVGEGPTKWWKKKA